MTDRMRHIIVILAWIALVIYFAMVVWVCFGHFSHLPDMSKPIWGIPQDKLIHFVMFFPFPFLVLFILALVPLRTKKLNPILVILLCGVLRLAWYFVSGEAGAA